MFAELECVTGQREVHGLNLYTHVATLRIDRSACSGVFFRWANSQCIRHTSFVELLQLSLAAHSQVMFESDLYFPTESSFGKFP